jgi:glycosyltransferase involved in cell wall biosynthesis
MRVAFVHDWLNGMRGGEKVLEALLAMFPGSTIYTLLHERGKVSPFIESHRIVTSWLNNVPGIYKTYRNLLPLFPAAIESLKLEKCDLIISSSHAVAKAVRSPGAPHVCYCHTPMRYIWDAEDDYRMGFGTKMVFKAVRPRLRKWDCETSRRVDAFIANSNFVRERIRRYYGRESEVVPPPIDTDYFSPSKVHVREDFYLAAGALVPYKRFDLVIRAFGAMNKHLVVAGSGPELKRLRSIATSNVDVKGWVSNDELRRLYRTAKALVYPAREDFGIVAVEAQSCGCPVIAYGVGGLAETVRDGVNGVLFTEQNEQDIIDAIARLDKRAWIPERVCEGVERFSREAFQGKIRKVIEELILASSHRGLAILPA